MPTIQELLQLLDARNHTIREHEECIRSCKTRISELEERLEKQELELESLRRMHFGHSSEKTRKPVWTELPLFPDYDPGEEVVDNTTPPIEIDDVVQAIEKESEERRKRREAKGKEKQKSRGMTRISELANLERVVEEKYPEGYDEQTMRIIGEDRTLTLEEHKSIYYLKEEVRYVCVRRSDANATRPRILQAPLQPRICAEGYLGNSLVSSMLVNKFNHHIPEYRQAKMLKEHGITLPTSTINRSLHRAIDALYPLYYAQMKLVLTSPYVHMDESTIPVNDRKGGTRKAYIWDVVDGSSANRGLFFFYRNGSRSQDIMRLILEGYRGAIHVDGYNVYNKADTTVLNCMAHARRKFEALKSKYPEETSVILKLFALLYQVEANLKEKNPSPEEITNERQAKSLPVLRAMERWMLEKQKECTPKSGLGEAISYTLTRWDKLCAYITDGIYQIDNNPVERSIRPLALGRKNWMFINNDESGEDLAVIQTLIGSCELLGINPKEWLDDVFLKISGNREYDAKALLPYNYAKQMK